MTASLELPDRLAAYLQRSGVALAVSVCEGDAPLMFVNDAFTKLTGYTEDEVKGRNCRFLQGEGTSEEQRQPLHDFVHGLGEDSGRFPILNYRKDGSEFLNYVFMSRIRDSSDAVRYIIASQFDMTNAMQRSKIRQNDETLRTVLSDVEQMGREYGLAMMSSAQQLADSVAMMARLSLRDTL